MTRSRTRQDWLTALVFGLALYATGTACTKKEDSAPAATAPAAPGAAPSEAPTAPRGAVHPITGTVKLNGAAPEMKMLKREADPYCGRVQMKDEEVIVSPSGGIKNVLVRLTKGVNGSYPAPATPASIDQTDCMFRPRVQGIMAGQPISVRNGDQTLHNVHTYKGASTIFNQAEIPGLPPMVKKFDGPSSIVKFKCDVHPWMTGYVAVTDHPFFAVTGDDGSFTIPNVPAGSYTIEAWHERFGTTTANVTVSNDKPGAVDMTLVPR
jgi:plastocyanin